MKSKTIYIGIDPGAYGCLCAQFPGGAIDVWRFKKEDENVELALRDLKEHADLLGYNIFALLEKVHSMPGQGVASCFTFGKNYGSCLGALRALQIPFKLITPQEWQKGLFVTKHDKKKHKGALVQIAKDRFPHVKVTADVADALLIMEKCIEVSQYF